MSRQYQDPNYLSGNYTTPYPYPSAGQAPTQQGQHTQPVQFIQPGQPLGQPLPISRDNYSDHSGQHAYTPSSYQESSMQHHPSGRRHSRSPYAVPMTLPVPALPGSSPSQPQTYLAPSQTTMNYSGGTHQQDRHGLHGYPPSTSDSHRYNTPGGSSTGGGSNLYSQGGYNATQTVQPHDYDDGGYDDELDSRSKAPLMYSAGARRPPCRFPGCNNPVLFDRRVNELREWCSDQHMRDAIVHRYEKPCKNCGQWPRRNGYKYCSGNDCRYPLPRGR